MALRDYGQMERDGEDQSLAGLLDVDAVRATIDDVVAAMFAIPEGEQRFPRGWWPSACCEPAATAIAGVLSDRGLGEWMLVSGKRPGESNGHMWVELREASGVAIYAIDVTLDQMSEFDSPFVGEGPSPAAQVFTEQRGVWRLYEWPYIGDEGGPFLENLRQVREILRDK
ncbi:hypothetical protein [Agromyces rhizosphaerae]|uniref:hypothetical protein n=1 Tax=Agromyces rhizosphaerae TaxID=88374 RepID=UPI002492E356|nr:hypothetical protein [Agromyces rhizosphaerae]